MEKVIDSFSFEDNIIQIRLVNVPKHPRYIARIFEILAEAKVNLDMISQVMAEDLMHLELTCDDQYQKELNIAIVALKEEFSDIEVALSKKYFKMAVGGKAMEDTPGAAAKIFSILGDNNIYFYQVSTSKRTVSFVIDKENKQLAIQKIQEAFKMEGK